MHILITRVDAIGDVVLTLPLCGYLKQIRPETHITILARSYTKAVIDASESVDGFIDYDRIFALPEEEQIAQIKQYKFDAILHLITQQDISTLARKAGIPVRVGTASRPYHWRDCNRLIWLRRKVSDEHEAVLHFRLLKPLGIKEVPDRLWRYYQMNKLVTLPAAFSNLLQTDKFTIILHPKSNKNALEWDLERFGELINLLDKDRYQVFITGSEKEQQELKPWIDTLPPHVTDLTGKLPLDQLITFIKHTDGLLAASTGPLHLAAALGINALGLYPNFRPKHGGRWGPIGPKADYMETETESLDSISAKEVFDRIKTWKKIS